MDIKVQFQMVCGNCGSLSVKIDDPEKACRETIIYCSNCGASRGTMGALRDLAERPAGLLVAHEAADSKVEVGSGLVALRHRLQSLRPKAGPKSQDKTA